MKRIAGVGPALSQRTELAPEKLALNPTVVAPYDLSEESLALETWYDAQPAVRRLWGVKTGQHVRVFVMLEPTPDGDDQFPVWLGNATSWAGELQDRIGCSVQLELVRESRIHAIEIDGAGAIIADLYWRDSTLD